MKILEQYNWLCRLWATVFIISVISSLSHIIAFVYGYNSTQLGLNFGLSMMSMILSALFFFNNLKKWSEMRDKE